jgi:hypothetical protein
MGISEVHISGLISIVIMTAVALWCILIILGHFSLQSSIFSSGISAAMASTIVGGTGGGLGALPPPWELPAPSVAQVRVGIYL